MVAARVWRFVEVCLLGVIVVHVAACGSALCRSFVLVGFACGVVFTPGVHLPVPMAVPLGLGCARTGAGCCAGPPFVVAVAGPLLFVVLALDSSRAIELGWFFLFLPVG